MSQCLPFVSVVVPVRNEKRHLERCLDPLLASVFPPSWLEILVADGMSSDQSREILTNYERRHSLINVFDNSERILPASGFTRSDTPGIVRRTQQRLGRDVDVVVESVQSIPWTKAGKLKAVISLFDRGNTAASVEAAQA